MQRLTFLDAQERKASCLVVKTYELVDGSIVGRFIFGQVACYARAIAGVNGIEPGLKNRPGWCCGNDDGRSAPKQRG